MIKKFTNWLASRSRRELEHTIIEILKSENKTNNKIALIIAGLKEAKGVTVLN